MGLTNDMTQTNTSIENGNLLAERIHNMSEAVTLKMSQAAAELQARGHDVISLSIGEPDFDTPQHIKDVAIAALNAGHTSYSPVPGIMALREAVCTKFQRDNGLAFTPANIVISNGAKQAIANVCQALLNEGDEVIIPAPFWVSYEEIIKQAGGVPVVLKTSIDNDFKVTAGQLEGAINDKTKILLFSNPCNPTGSVYNRQELSDIAEVIGATERVCIISDEIYEYINFTGEHVSIGQFETVKDRTATVNGFSKGFAMTGWRLGFMGAPAWLARACAKVQGNSTSGACNFSQVAAAHALLSDLKPTLDMRDVYLRRRDLVIRLLSEIPGFKVNCPEGAFYIFPDVSAYLGKSDGERVIHTVDDLCDYIINSVYVGVVPGSAFGDDNCFRISFATSDELLVEAISRIKQAVSVLR